MLKTKAVRASKRHPDGKGKAADARHEQDVAKIDFASSGDSVGAKYETFLEAARIVESGLPFAAVARLQQTSGLTLDRIKVVAGISEGSFARRKQSGLLSREESERLLRVSRIFERATALFDGDQVEAVNWLETSIPSLGNQRPFDLTQTEPGAREVENLIGRIQNGVVS